MNRPSILFINRVYPPVRGATGRVLRDLARSFARQGWQVTVITSGPKPIKAKDGAVRVIRVRGPEKPRNALSYGVVWLRMLVAALRLPASNVVVSMTDPPMQVVAGHIIKKFKKNHHIHWCQDLYPDILPSLGVKTPGFVWDKLRAMSRKAMKSADKVIVVGRCMAKHLADDGFSPQQITVIPNWPDFELVRPENRQNFNDHSLSDQADEESWLETAQLNGYRTHDQQFKQGPKFRVLYAGNIGRAHPIDTVLEAAEMLNARQPDIEFVFVGDGPRYDEIAKQRSNKHLDNIRLLPYQPVNRLKDLMQSGDVHLISMHDDAAGMIVPSKLYSSLAAQRPCLMVGPNHSEAAKVIHDFGAGRVIAHGHAEELVEEILQFRLNSDKWFQAHEGAAQASQIFVPRESINAWIERAWGVVQTDMMNE